jgi:uncharacterized protein YbcC (UPF0753/DUF2309 family)
MGISFNNLHSQIDEAGRLIAPLWPLSMSVAMNPLSGLVNLTFDEAVREAGRWLPLRNSVSLQTEAKGGCETGEQAGLIECHPNDCTDEMAFDRDIARWCLRATTGGITVLPGESLITSWRRLHVADRVTRRLLGKDVRILIAGMPIDDEALLIELVEQSGVAEIDRVGFFRALLARLPGWAGHARWQRLNQDVASLYSSLTLTDLVALQLLYRVGAPQRHWRIGESAATMQVHRAHKIGAGVGTLYDSGRLLSEELAGAELAYREHLLTQVARSELSSSSPLATAQFLFCMDPRSEAIRRSLETVSGYETYGVAGFFGVPLRLAADDGTPLRDLGPPLAKPLFELQIDPAAVGVEEDLWSTGDAVKAVKEAGAAPYLGAEVGGLFAGIDALRRTLGSFIASPKIAGSPFRRDRNPGFAELERQVCRSLESLGPAELDNLATSLGDMLVTLGLKRQLAPLVVLVGHRATSVNNAYGASLQCGACGGSRGTVNASVAATMLNAAQIRSRLGAQGIDIPGSTHFVAAEHITTTETIRLVDVVEEGRSTDPGISDVIDNLDRIGTELGSYVRRRRSRDWSEVRPEMGLIHNAALVIGPRSLTRDADLAGRVFLHSYQPDDDDDNGSLLTAIFAGPMVVAHWINMAYLFSSIEPVIFGAGDKTLHNVVGRFGVVEGSGWDLKMGLPEQSVTDVAGYRHEPLRLLVLVDALAEVVDLALSEHETVSQLVSGGWVRMLSRSDTGGWVERTIRGEWIAVVG